MWLTLLSLIQCHCHCHCNCHYNGIQQVVWNSLALDWYFISVLLFFLGDCSTTTQSIPEVTYWYNGRIYWNYQFDSTLPLPLHTTLDTSNLNITCQCTLGFNTVPFVPLPTPHIYHGTYSWLLLQKRYPSHTLTYSTIHDWRPDQGPWHRTNSCVWVHLCLTLVPSSIWTAIGSDHSPRFRFVVPCHTPRLNTTVASGSLSSTREQNRHTFRFGCHHLSSASPWRSLLLLL